MTDTARHFKNCHPEDSQGPPAPVGYKPTDPENCWHCDTPTVRACYCDNCLDGADDIPPEMVYHCRTCGRWWSYMYLRILEWLLPGRPASDEQG